MFRAAVSVACAAASLFKAGTLMAGGAMAGIARNIELYNSAYSLAWKHISELRKREKPNIALRLHDSIQHQIKTGATEPLFIASEALRDVEFNPETWD
jgi:hypothetical protein